MATQLRGKVTDRIKVKSKELLGYEIETTELRLMAYIQYVMTNNQKLDPASLNANDRLILTKWRRADYIEGGISGLRITEDFWRIICELIFLGYVDITD